ncbi:MAG: fibrobacter succinogenes major paralogous domain-containing protein [Candidatus Babeliaceae bacterium]|nr:fibrobacter succinogenes major paralogous domain-containing protein [Candidatus Babeliaceae bacterium]
MKLFLLQNKMHCNLIISFVIIFCISCINNPTDTGDKDAVASDKAALEIGYAHGDSASSVTRNITLPHSGQNGTTILWVSNNSIRVSNEGIVTRPYVGNVTVILTATIVKGVESDVKEFSLIVKECRIYDINGNVYRTIIIGDREWTAENLRATSYNDGTPIPYVPDSALWSNLTSPGYCYYNNNTRTDSIQKFGALYNWYTVDTKKLAPNGWHIPTESEWWELEAFMIANAYNWDHTVVGNKIAKSLAAATDWELADDLGAIGNDLLLNNSSGFSALPGGIRAAIGVFASKIRYGYWWSSTSETNQTYAYYRMLFCRSEELLYMFQQNKRYGFSVRLIKDN